MALTTASLSIQTIFSACYAETQNGSGLVTLNTIRDTSIWTDVANSPRNTETPGYPLDSNLPTRGISLENLETSADDLTYTRTGFSTTEGPYFIFNPTLYTQASGKTTTWRNGGRDSLGVSSYEFKVSNWDGFPWNPAALVTYDLSTAYLNATPSNAYANKDVTAAELGSIIFDNAPSNTTGFSFGGWVKPNWQSTVNTAYPFWNRGTVSTTARPTNDGFVQFLYLANSNIANREFRIQWDTNNHGNERVDFSYNPNGANWASNNNPLGQNHNGYVHIAVSIQPSTNVYTLYLNGGTAFGGETITGVKSTTTFNNTVSTAKSPFELCRGFNVNNGNALDGECYMFDTFFSRAPFTATQVSASFNAYQQYSVSTPITIPLADVFVASGGGTAKLSYNHIWRYQGNLTSTSTITPINLTANNSITTPSIAADRPKTTN